jgi:hypothetical protein
MANRRIHVKGGYIHEEAVAAEAGIYPGMLVSVNSDGKLIKNDTKGEQCERAFAVEDVLQGKSVDDIYALADVVTYYLALPGSVMAGLIKAGEDITKSELLISNGDGTLVGISSLDSGSSHKAYVAVAIAMAACDLSGPGAVNTLCSIRIL